MNELCQHPTLQCFYEGGEDEEGEWENYYCKACNRDLPPSMVTTIQGRADWVTWQTEQ